MPKVTFVHSGGSCISIDAEPSDSLMYAAVTNGIEGIEAECGGGMVCGTCHVQVVADWFCKVGAPSADENEVLDGLSDVCATSRLACQIIVAPELDGLTVIVPPHRRSDRQ